MALAFPVMAFRDDLGVKDLGSLGVDCHSNNSAFIPGEARIGLQGARGARNQVRICAHRPSIITSSTLTTNQVAESKGKSPLTVHYTVEEAFNLATIRGAHAMKMSDRIGSLAEGKLADFVIFDANSPSMICAGVHDPVAAIILHSSPADVDTVIIDGIVRKQDGKLLDVRVDETGSKVAGQETLMWSDVARNLISTRERIESEAQQIDYDAAEKAVMEAFHIPAESLEDPW